MSVCIKDLIQNMNLVIGCTVGCPYCYARNNVKRYHMIDDFSQPEFFPGKLRMMDKPRPQNFLLTGMSDLAGWKPGQCLVRRDGHPKGGALAHRRPAGKCKGKALSRDLRATVR